MQTRDRLHRLIDDLPEQDLPEVEQLLAHRQRGEPSLRERLADAPIDDEPLTAEDEAALDEAYRDIEAGRVIPDDELWRRLGHAATG